MLPIVSVIIPFYNCKYVQQAVESALAQTYPMLEVIVVDDGSTQNTHLLDTYQNRIRYIFKQNGGTASALNTGIKAAKGDYIAWLSSDDHFYPNKLSRQLSFMYGRNASISCTDYDYIDSENRLLHSVTNPTSISPIEFHRKFIEICPVNGCTVILKKELLMESVGMFNEKLLYTHDYDLWCRVIISGYDFHYLPETLLKYRYHTDMGTLKHHTQLMQEFMQLKGLYAPIIERRIKLLESR